MVVFPIIFKHVIPNNDCVLKFIRRQIGFFIFCVHVHKSYASIYDCEIDYPRTSAFATSGKRKSNFSETIASRNHIAQVRMNVQLDFQSVHFVPAAQGFSVRFEHIRLKKNMSKLDPFHDSLRRYTFPHLRPP